MMIRIKKKWLCPLLLVILFIILTAAVVPEGCIYGSNTDWLSQHATLAESIRNACLEQYTLLPSWLSLGGGSNGYQFAYYGFLRPDILIGCLFPQISMTAILIWYMLAVFLVSVLLCYVWLRSEEMGCALSFMGSVLFMTAGCLFHMHRQVMFVNYLPFLLLAFICVRKRRFKWLPLCMLMICLSSFYFAISAFAAIGWYWMRTEGTAFWKTSFLRRYIPSSLLAAGMAAALLIPTGLILLEHKRAGNAPGLLELFFPNPAMNNLLFNEYGMGLTFVCLYSILAGLRIKKMRSDSVLFLLFGLFGVCSWILNAALYARPKILIPFMPLVVLHCMRFLRLQMDEGNTCRPPLAPFLFMIPVGLLWFSQKQYPWIIADVLILLSAALLIRWRRRGQRTHCGRSVPAAERAERTTAGRRAPHSAAAIAAVTVLLLAAPIGLYITTASTEDWVARSEAETGFTKEELSRVDMNPLYHFDSLTSPLVSGNEYTPGVTRSTMYSSVTNPDYSGLYYDTLMTPIRINNRIAMLTSDDPFMLTLLGARYVETTADNIPAGYSEILRSGENVLAENENVLPAAYFTEDTVSQEWFDTLGAYEKLDVITQKTVVDDPSAEEIPTHGSFPADQADGSFPEDQADKGFPADQTDAGQEEGADVSAGDNMRLWEPEFVLPGSSLSAGLEITRTGDGWEITADKECTLNVDIADPSPGDIVLMQFHVENLTHSAVVIDINGIRNKLSGTFAPYPNGNRDFHYQFSADSDSGVDRLEITFSKGHYKLSGVAWRLYRRELLGAKEYTPLSLTSFGMSETAAADAQSGAYPVLSGTVDAQSGAYPVLSGTVDAQGSGYLATSIPVQNGLKIFVDGKDTPLVTVNEAFAGVPLEKGTHRIDVRFSPPGKAAGCAVSLAASVGYVIYLLAGTFRSARRRNRLCKRNNL